MKYFSLCSMCIILIVPAGVDEIAIKGTLSNYHKRKSEVRTAQASTGQFVDPWRHTILYTHATATEIINGDISFV